MPVVEIDALIDVAPGVPEVLEGTRALQCVRQMVVGIQQHLHRHTVPGELHHTVRCGAQPLRRRVMQIRGRHGMQQKTFWTKFQGVLGVVDIRELGWRIALFAAVDASVRCGNQGDVDIGTMRIRFGPGQMHIARDALLVQIHRHLVALVRGDERLLPIRLLRQHGVSDRFIALAMNA